MIKQITSVICALMVLANVSISVSASSAEADTSGHLKVICEDKDTPLEDVTFRIYKIGERDLYENILRIDEDFSDTDIDLTSLTDKELADAVDIYSKAIDDNGIKADYTFSTNSYGFIEEQLPFGVYFLEMDGFTRDDKEWTSTPAVVEINDWKEIEEVTPKMSSEKITEDSTPDDSSTTDTSDREKKDEPHYPDSTTENAKTGFAVKTVGGIGLLFLAGLVGSQIGKKKSSDDEEE